MVRSAENEVQEQMCIKLLSQYHCILCLPFKPIHIHYKKKSLQNIQKIIWNKVFHTELINLDFLWIDVHMLLLQQSQLSQIISHLTTPLDLSLNLSYLQKPPQNPRFTQCSQTFLPVSQSHETFKTTSAIPTHLPNSKSFLGKARRTTLETTACQAHLVHAKIMGKITLGGTEKYLEDSTVFGHSQHIFMRGGPACQTWFFSVTG